MLATRPPIRCLEGRRLRQQPGMVRVFEDVISGRTFERPDLQALFDCDRKGDALCVVSIALADPCASRRKPSISSKPVASDGFRSKKTLIRRPPPVSSFSMRSARSPTLNDDLLPSAPATVAPRLSRTAGVRGAIRWTRRSWKQRSP
jgi:hypothetical protein